jgi:hypothetical protein
MHALSAVILVKIYHYETLLHFSSHTCICIMYYSVVSGDRNCEIETAVWIFLLCTLETRWLGCGVVSRDL